MSVKGMLSAVELQHGVIDRNRAVNESVRAAAEKDEWIQRKAWRLSNATLQDPCHTGPLRNGLGYTGSLELLACIGWWLIDQESE